MCSLLFVMVLCHVNLGAFYQNFAIIFAKVWLKNNLHLQEHCADAQEQKNFSQIGKSCEEGFLKISFGKY